MTDYYGTPAAARAYLTAHNLTVPAAWVDDNALIADLLVASEWLDGVFGPQFSGTKVGLRNQVREQPRNGQWDWNYYAVDATTIPREVEWATYQAAMRQRNKPGSLTLDYTPGKYRRVQIDGALSVDYANFLSVSDIQIQFAVIDQLLQPLLTGRGRGAISGLAGAGVRA